MIGSHGQNKVNVALLSILIVNWATVSFPAQKFIFYDRIIIRPSMQKLR